MKKLKSLKDIELLKKEKSSKISTYILFVILAIVLFFSINDYMENGFSNTSIMPLLILALVVTNYETLRSIKKEKKERNLE